MQQEHIWNLIAKKLSGESSPEELRELEDLLRKSPELHYPMQTIMDIWNIETGGAMENIYDKFYKHTDRMRELGVDYDPEIINIQDTNEEKVVVPKNNRTVLWGVLGLVAAVLLVFFGVRFSANKNILTDAGEIQQVAKAFSEVSTKNGSKTNLILPDGTKVWLNAGSKLTYDSFYGKKIREVSLSGEGFFDVVKNKEKPFIIHASSINIKVLGTEFNVRSYPNDKTTEASLIRGSIEVTFKNKPAKKVILKPNEKIVVENINLKEREVVAVEHNSSPKVNDLADDVAIKNLTYEHKTGAIIETSWVDNRLIFQDESFEDIAKQLERWYGVFITFQNEQLKENHLTGSFKNETIRQALDALKFTASFNYSIDNSNNIIIY
ncbi:MAG TPA: FecR family protein [Puia sp.]|nr:FecR family protein [Puia sp.]